MEREANICTILSVLFRHPNSESILNGIDMDVISCFNQQILVKVLHHKRNKNEPLALQKNKDSPSGR